MAVILGLPVAVPVKLTEHLPFDNAQFAELNEPAPLDENVTVPVGIIPDPMSVSVTVAVHVEATLTRTGLLHETDVLVERGFTVILAGVAVELPV